MLVNNGVETILPGEFTLNPISISSVFPVKGFVGTQLKIIGAGFNPGYLSNVVKIGGVAVSTWNSDKNTINISVPESLVSGTYTVEVNNGVTNAVLANSFTVVTPKITGFSPSSGYFGSEVIIQGENLYSISYVNFGSIGAEIVSKDTSMIKVKVPSGITPGVTHISVNFGNKNYPSTDEFTILSPVITSFSPSSGTPGTEIIIKGNGFTAGYYNNTGVRFGTISTTVVSITSTEIKALVPSNAGEGAMKIAVVMPGITVVSTTDFTITK